MIVVAIQRVSLTKLTASDSLLVSEAPGLAIDAKKIHILPAHSWKSMQQIERFATFTHKLPNMI
jgi:hypothetical protein